VSTPIIEVSALHKRYGKQVAIEEVSFTVEQGEIFGLVGAERGLARRPPSNASKAFASPMAA
jgi:ABC-type phosphonate transport system ATPase subunit